MPTQAIVSDFAKHLIEEMTEYSYTEFKMDKTIRPRVIISFSDRRVSSWGGLYYQRPYLNLALRDFVVDGNYFSEFKEYDHIKDDPTIGEMIEPHWTESLIALIAHEYAHTMQFAHVHAGNIFKGNKLRKLFQMSVKPPKTYQHKLYDTTDVSHDKFWQIIYRDFRTTWINDYAVA
jgi:hypothetical protein